MSEIVQPLRFCDVLYISRSTCTYTYTATAEKQRVSQLRMYAQLTRSFSAVAELLVDSRPSQCWINVGAIDAAAL